MVICFYVIVAAGTLLSGSLDGLWRGVWGGALGFAAGQVVAVRRCETTVLRTLLSTGGRSNAPTLDRGRTARTLGKFASSRLRSNVL